MKVNFDAKILDLKGNPLKDGTADLTLSDVTCAALIAVLQDDQNADSNKKMKLFRLAQTATKGGEQEVPAEDVVLLKERVSKMYSALIVGRVFDLLEGSGA